MVLYHNKFALDDLAITLAILLPMVPIPKVPIPKLPIPKVLIPKVPISMVPICMVPISKAQQIDKRAFQFAKRGTA